MSCLSLETNEKSKSLLQAKILEFSHRSVEIDKEKASVMPPPVSYPEVRTLALQCITSIIILNYMHIYIYYMYNILDSNGILDEQGGFHPGTSTCIR
jgi:hypothetical protein